MKTIRTIYAGFDRMIEVDRFWGWFQVFWIHYFAILAVTFATVWGDPREGFLWAAIAFLSYAAEVHRLALKETRAELARLKADHA